MSSFQAQFETQFRNKIFHFKTLSCILFTRNDNSISQRLDHLCKFFAILSLVRDLNCAILVQS